MYMYMYVCECVYVCVCDVMHAYSHTYIRTYIQIMRALQYIQELLKFQVHILNHTQPHMKKCLFAQRTATTDWCNWCSVYMYDCLLVGKGKCCFLRPVKDHHNNKYIVVHTLYNVRVIGFTEITVLQ